MLGIYFVFTILILFSIFVITVTFRNRSNITTMGAMTVCMGLGMSASLLAGLMFGILHQGDLFTSTLISILVGIIIGIVCGVFINLPASIEGGLSGLMGGMMGAMLGEMIRIEHHEMILRLMFILFICTSILLVVVILNDLKSVIGGRIEDHSLNRILIFAILTLGIQLFIDLLPPTHSENMNTSNLVTIDVQNYTLDSDNTNLPQGISYEFKIRNLSHSEHKITIIPKQLTGNDEVLISKTLSHGSESTFNIPKLPKGEYIVYCEQPGHRERGMESHLIIS